ITRKISQPLFFSLTADRIVEQKRLADRKPHRSRMRADLLELSDVVLVLILARHQGPDVRDLVFLDVQHPRSLWGVGPFMQGSAKVIAAEIVAFEGEL